MSDDAVQPRAHGAGVMSAVMRRTAADFRVDEIDAFEASGTGEHLLLTIEKRGMNTAFAARRIAEWAGVAEVAIGYAGLKDRHAVTRQRISVHLPGRDAPPIDTLEDADLRVIAHTRHAKKLPRGALAGNRFELRLRDVDGARDAIDARLETIAQHGVPNYFGEQRFGREAGNVDAALAMFAGRRFGRDQRTLLLSAARSALFNQVLAARVTAGSWNRALEGDVWMLDGSRSVFGPEPGSEPLHARLAAFDIHPTGPLWGRGTLRTTAGVQALELDALSDPRALALRDGLERAGLKQERRATRLRPQALAWDWCDDGLALRFDLPAGCYATVVLAELGEVRNGAAAGRPAPGMPTDG
ncbi:MULTISPECIES: tRNA pseudouridine(13) synthase TruD [Luteimonas]|uniref:tRNA pseudouridine(13) synthase TruD n=1 Tax=Luteimonas TaxID=83614 RepID=UPI000C7A91C6|nr:MULTISPECIES: tRNA pseudouridine(13) synthase TruD [Luteimonas]